MPKRLAVCFDGTWNTPDQKDRGRVRPTNVAKTALAIARRGRDRREQVVFYDPGVGTGWGKLDRLLGGAFGLGLNENIRQGYRFLVQHYRPGDQIFLFGFSRGAYTARSCAGLIRNSGLLRRDDLDKLDQAFRLYRSRRPDAHPRAREARLFRRSFSHEPELHFIGVWDTVGALGIPLSGVRWINRLLGLQFHDTQLSSHVRHAHHAVAIDERRGPFVPTLWTRPAPVRGQKMEQVWFAGVHSNIGGGYADSGLSDIAFEWMRARAEAAGLTYSRAALRGLAIRPRWDGVLRDSRRGLYRLLPGRDRPIGRAAGGNESVAAEARLRYRRDRRYRPPELVRYLEHPPRGHRRPRAGGAGRG